MALIRKLFWAVLFLVSTFCFVVLFDHGPTDYVNSVKTEIAYLKQFMGWKIEKKKDDSDKTDTK